MSGPNYFDAPVAARYDADAADMFDPAVLDPTVDVLAELAGPGPVLEFAIGTGRVALPLAERGLQVHGIELSPDMVDQLRAKLGGADLPVTIGDMVTTRVDGTFTLVYLVWNTIKNLTSQDEQVACFRNAAAHLQAGGRFVVEVMTPQLQRLAPGETMVPFDVTPEHIGIDEYDIANQGLVSHHYTFGDEPRQLSVPFRYVWPAELDLMARLAGMSLESRWAGWRREPFTSTSECVVSVWRLVSG